MSAPARKSPEKRKAFMIGFIVFFLLIAGVMLIRSENPRQAQTGQHKAPVALQAQAPAAKDRMKKKIDFRAEAKPAQTADLSNWTRGEIEGKTVWRDAKTGLVWGPKLETTFASYRLEDIRKAIDLCAAEKPAGTWALPTASEIDTAKVNGLIKADPEAHHRWLAYTEKNSILLPAARGWLFEDVVSVRCVARAK